MTKVNVAKILHVLQLLKREKAEENYVSPNFVNDFANIHGITLSYAEVVVISNTYGRSYDKAA